MCEIDKSKTEVAELLKKNSIKLKDIFIMMCDENGNFDIIRRDEK